MHNLIDILSTVVLVSTVCTLVFAVLAYAVARRKRLMVGRDADEEEQVIAEEELEPLPAAPAPPAVPVPVPVEVQADQAARRPVEDPFASERTSGAAFKAYRPDQAKAMDEEELEDDQLGFKWR